MVGENKLLASLQSIDTKKLVDEFGQRETETSRLEKAAWLLAVWCHQLEAIDAANPARGFLRAMQMDSMYVMPLLGIGLYKPAAASMRSMVEAALQYIYFRDHPAELETLKRETGYYCEKSHVLEYLKAHSVGFAEMNAKLSVAAKLEPWYKRISNIVHGSVPGVWVPHNSLSTIAHNGPVLLEAVDMYEKAVAVVHWFFLVTVAQRHWIDFGHDAKEILLKGIGGTEKAILKLDKA